MKFEHAEVFNLEGALRGMRNPLNSWHKADSIFDIFCEHEDFDFADEVAGSWATAKLENKEFESEDTHDKEYEDTYAESRSWLYENGFHGIGTDHHFTVDFIGPNDMDLCQRLGKAGPEHRKYLRQIFVSVDITAPLYWWKEADTYKIGTTANSTSTMHRIDKDPITLDCFETGDYCGDLVYFTHNGDSLTDYTINDIVQNIIEDLEALRQKYKETKDKKYWKELIRWLPNGWLQTRTWTANYEVLRNIYHQRKNHKLVEWHAFCKWVESLPYAKELIID